VERGTSGVTASFQSDRLTILSFLNPSGVASPTVCARRNLPTHVALPHQAHSSNGGPSSRDNAAAVTRWRPDVPGVVSGGGGSLVLCGRLVSRAGFEPAVLRICPWLRCIFGWLMRHSASRSGSPLVSSECDCLYVFTMGVCAHIMGVQPTHAEVSSGEWWWQV